MVLTNALDHLDSIKITSNPSHLEHAGLSWHEESINSPVLIIHLQAASFSTPGVDRQDGAAVRLLEIVGQKIKHKRPFFN